VRSRTTVAAALFLAGSVAAHGTDPSAGKIAADIPVWKMITLGTHASGHSLQDALKAARYGVGDAASSVLKLPEFRGSKATRKVSLAVLSVADLGFKAEGASLEEIYDRVARRGLGLCPAEVAPELRLQYVHQPIGEFLHVAMKPVVMANGDAVGLSVGNGGAGLLLVGRNIRPDLVVPPNIRFVFCPPFDRTARR
jgi:hypothetical protein